MLKDSDVRHWYENLRRGSKIHGDLSLKRLKAFCVWSKLSHSGIISSANDDIEKFHYLEDYVAYLAKGGKSTCYISDLLKPIRSWLRTGSKMGYSILL